MTQASQYSYKTIKPKTNRHMIIASSQPNKHKASTGVSLTSMISQQLAASKTVYTRVRTSESGSKTLTPSKVNNSQSLQGGNRLSKRLDFINEDCEGEKLSQGSGAYIANKRGQSIGEDGFNASEENSDLNILLRNHAPVAIKEGKSK